jgi:hypothetical protein
MPTTNLIPLKDYAKLHGVHRDKLPEHSGAARSAPP